MSNLSFLIVDICILSLQVITSTSNGCILFLFFKVKKLRRGSGFRLLLFLSCTDFLHAVTTIPYIIYLTTHWHPANIQLDPYFVMLSSIPLTIQLKVNLTLTISIAFERALALFLPVAYRRFPTSTYSWSCLAIGCLLAALDVTLEFLLSPFNKSPNCAAIGCFVSSEFRYYWGTSNMVMGILVILLTVVLIVKLRIFEAESQSRRITTDRDSSNFNQANRSTAGILLSSLIFVTIPSVGVGFVEMLGYSIFKRVGPFYIVGLLCAGACNAIIYVALNRDMRNLAKSCILRVDPAGRTIMTSTKIFSTSKFHAQENH